MQSLVFVMELLKLRNKITTQKEDWIDFITHATDTEELRTQNI